MKELNRENCNPKETRESKDSSKREKYEIPSIMFVPVKLEERLMDGTCAKTGAEGSPCSEPFQFS